MFVAGVNQLRVIFLMFQRAASSPTEYLYGAQTHILVVALRMTSMRRAGPIINLGIL